MSGLVLLPNLPEIKQCITWRKLGGLIPDFEDKSYLGLLVCIHMQIKSYKYILKESLIWILGPTKALWTSSFNLPLECIYVHKLFNANLYNIYSYNWDR